LVAGDTATIHYAVTVDSTWPAGLTEISNTATVTDDGANGVDPTPGDNSASDTTPIDAAPDIVVTKSDGGITTAPGGTVVYTLTIENVGNQDATGIVLTESVPANAMFNSVTSTPGWNLAGTSFNVGNLAAGASTTVIYAVNVVNPLPAGVTEIANTASAADDGSNGPDLNLTSNSATDTTPVIATADINITKSDGGATTVPGGTVTYTLIIQNVGNQAATGVIVSETVWANATFNSVASSVGWNAAGTSYTVGNLAAGAAIAIQYAVNVANPLPAGVTEISNTATAADDGTNGLDPTLANNTANDTTPVTATPDITISKSDGGVTATPGSVVTYTLTIRNVGNQDATGIVVTETVPANTTFNAGASTTGWNAGGTSFTVGTLAAGATATVLYTVTVNSPAPSGLTQIDNTASAADDGTNGVDATPGNNSSSDSTPVVLVPDITITKSDGGMIATPGSVVTYTLTVSNVGNEDATGVVVTEAVPVNATFNSGSSTAGWNAAGTSYTIGNLAAGASATIQYAITVNSTVPAGVTQISNTATAADDGSNGSDATPLNNTASDTTPVIAAPDIRIIKFDGGITTVPGGTVVYTLVIQNVGNQDATGVVVSETVPANATFNSVLSSSGWNAAGTSYSVGDLSAGATVAVTYAVTVASSLPAGITQITNTANVADDGANGADPTPGSNTSSDSTPVIAAPDVTIVKDDGGVTSLPGGTIVYTLTVRNVGNQDATGIVISEIVPANTTFNSASSTPGWNLAGTTFNLPTLAAGGTITIDYAVTVDNPLPPGVIVIDNTASVTDDGSNGSDPSPLNNTDSDVTPLGAATIGDLVWLDLNADGVHDSGEPRIANVQVQATWFGSDGNPGGGDDIGFMTFTDLTGAYSLSGLPAGNYRIDILPFTLPEPLVPTFDIDGIGTPHSSLRTLVAGETATDLDFGYAGTATIGDRIWYDRDLNGAQDAGEPGLVGVGITLTWAGPNGTIGDTDDEVFTTMTGTNGAYFFANLLAGAYRIDVNPATLPAGTTSTFDPDGGGDNTANLLVAPGSVNNNVDFGYAGSRTVGDRVWFDSNGNGVDDPGEPGLVRATVLLHYAGVDATFGTADDIELTTTTTTGGEYSFSSLPAGFYHSIVSAGLPVGLTPTFDHDDATPIVDGVANFTVSGVDRSEIDFGFTGSLSVGNLVFLDLDANGTADAGEPELYGVDVALIFAGADGIFGNSNDLTFTDTTDAGGLFQFDN
jgi:uncharacterized repeat protein (TIGR01451 family)